MHARILIIYICINMYIYTYNTTRPPYKETIGQYTKKLSANTPRNYRHSMNGQVKPSAMDLGHDQN
jgi:hypothetical protein